MYTLYINIVIFYVCINRVVYCSYYSSITGSYRLSTVCCATIIITFKLYLEHHTHNNVYIQRELFLNTHIWYIKIELTSCSLNEACMYIYIVIQLIVMVGFEEAVNETI